MKTTFSGRLAAGALCILALAGCASSPYEGKYAWSEGWRKAEVVSVQTAAEMERPRFYSCVRTASPGQLATARFAVVKYREIPRTQQYAVLLQPDVKVAVGDAVYVKAGDCKTPLVQRASAERPMLRR
jgi:hypothetical protein